MSITWQPWEQSHTESECGHYRVSTYFALERGQVIDRYRAWADGSPIGSPQAEIEDAQRLCEEHAAKEGQA